MLDLFCGAGGAAMGYYRAGFEVVGVDIVKQDNYPFKFIQADAIKFARKEAKSFDAIHASPPCQKYSTLAAGNKNAAVHLDLVHVVRDILFGAEKPYIIENVPGAPLHDPVMLCGEMFKLKVIRHRLFETSFEVKQPHHPAHRGLTTTDNHKKRYTGHYYAVYGDGGGKGSLADWKRAMGIQWMKRKAELALAIPPAYTTLIGQYAYDELLGVK